MSPRICAFSLFQLSITVVSNFSSTNVKVTEYNHAPFEGRKEGCTCLLSGNKEQVCHQDLAGDGSFDALTSVERCFSIFNYKAQTGEVYMGVCF